MKLVRAILCPALALTALLVGCANPGSGPDGGPYDEKPPQIVNISPALGETSVKKAKKIVLEFDENIKIENAAENVVISPPQIETPEIKTNSKRISIELMDTLRPNTTYTIDFSDAIQDATEGNPLGNFTYSFSTGETLDTMEVSGYVLAAENLEPVQGILVGLYAERDDSVFRTKPLERVGRTNSAGHFSIKGIAPGSYRIYALKDMDGDFKWTEGEMLAFSDQIIEPSGFPDVRYDTVWRDTIQYDSIRTIHYTHFLPDDIILRAYSEVKTTHALLKTVREEPNRFTAYFTAPNTQAPTIALPGGAKADFLEVRNATLDTITYWTNDSTIIKNDSLTILYTYEYTNDSTGVNSLRTDTLELRPRLTFARQAKMKAEEDKKWQKALERRHKRGDFSQETRSADFLKITESLSSKITPMQNPAFELAEPITQIDESGIHLTLHVDSLEENAPFEVKRDGQMRFSILGEWRPQQHYTLRIDSAAIVGFTGKHNKPIKRDFRIFSEEDLGALFVDLVGADTGAVVQLLSSDTKVAAQVRAEGSRAEFYYLKAGEYHLRLFYDQNANNTWDPGSLRQHRQPEEVVYYPKNVAVKENWDTEITWDVRAAEPLKQKPGALSKSKANSKKEGAHAKNIQRLREKGKTTTEAIDTSSVIRM